MTSSRATIIFKSTAALTSAIIVFATIAYWPWYASPVQIESHLLADTPIGSSEAQVMTHLGKVGARFKEPWRGRVEPNTGYPPNTIGGSSFINAVVAEYRIVFITSVEALYIFDNNQNLVEIAVRKSTDAL